MYIHDFNLVLIMYNHSMGSSLMPRILFLLILTTAKCCELECLPGEVCVFKPENEGMLGAQVCVPEGETTQDSSSWPMMTEETTTLTIMRPRPEISNKTYNICDSDTYDRPDSDRECESGFSCTYGVCMTDEAGSSSWCDCDPGASGQICDEKCCRNCVFGTCYYYTEETREVCNCQPDYSGQFCEIKNSLTTTALPKEVTWHYWVVGACALVLVLLVILMVVVPYILWKNRVIVVMKVVHYFQGYEDDDDRQWDAFISYKSNKADELFVVNTLFPKLEREFGFKINVHFRDFIAGETIANNIITAVQGSRRTIMIITPSYVTSEFTKLEYQVAQQEMLKRKHRIIPILLEDIAQVKETMDPNLKVILNSVTYVEWPKCGTDKKMEKFWKRLELSMPKIKKRENDYQMGVLV